MEIKSIFIDIFLFILKNLRKNLIILCDKANFFLAKASRKHKIIFILFSL